MKKIILTLAAAATLAAATVAAPDTADARCRFNCGLAIGLGAGIVGAAILAPRYQPYAVVQGYEPYPTYVAAAPVDCPGGYWGRRCLASDGFGNCVRVSRPRFFCPAGY